MFVLDRTRAALRALLMATALGGTGLATAVPVSVTGTQLATIDAGLLGGPDANLTGVQYTIASTQAQAALLMRFDLASLAGWQVDSDAILTLAVNGIWNGNLLMPVLVVYRLNEGYDAATVTLNNHGGHGADVLASAAPVLTDAPGQSVSFTLSGALLQDWIDTPGGNFGLLVEEASFMDLRGHSDISWGTGVAGAAPLLMFEARGAEAPEPMSPSLVCLAIAALLLARRRDD
ncbi:MAG: hypothetical protein ACLGI6_11045 [Gammaproteobacteria bacterium]